MSRKKGMSIEEKVLKVEEFFAERQEPFTMKELEAALPKAKGVIWQSVQECVTQLVAENRVQTERIGVFQLFWHFSATASNALGSEAADLERCIERAEVRRDAAEATLASREAAAASAGTEDACVRDALQSELDALKAEHNALETRLANVSDCDPVVFRELQLGASAALDLANVWVDNILTLEAVAGRRMGMGRAEFRRKFAVPPNLAFLDPRGDAAACILPQATSGVLPLMAAPPAAIVGSRNHQAPHCGRASRNASLLHVVKR